MDRDAIEAELLEIEGMLQDEKLKDEDRHALHGASQALRSMLESQTRLPELSIELVAARKGRITSSSLRTIALLPQKQFHLGDDLSKRTARRCHLTNHFGPPSAFVLTHM